MILFEAEVVVTTKKEMDNGTHRGDWFQLSDYGDAGEFHDACLSFFADEENPVFRYPGWENIPDCLINREWFCPNFFEIRDAFEQLDEEDFDCFMAWCGYHGHNIVADDPYLLVARFQENHTPNTELDCDQDEAVDDALVCQSVISDFYDMERYSTEVFNDNYD